MISYFSHFQVGDKFIYQDNHLCEVIDVARASVILMSLSAPAGDIEVKDLKYCYCTTNFCQQCAGSHGPNDPCPAAIPSPYFQFNNVPTTTGRINCGSEETDLLTAKTWQCEACGTHNDEDKFPGRCSICRRYR